MKRVFTLLFILLYSFSNAWAQRFACNNPLVGYNYVVDNVDEGILSVLSGGNSFNNLLDQDLTNFTQINVTAVLLGGKIVSVKRITGSFSSGKKVGFVIEVPGSAVTLDLLSGLSLRTYLNNGIQETVSLGGGSGLLKLSLLNSGTPGHKRIEFTTTLPFDEVELIKSSAVEALANIRVYNAYVSDASCNNDCLITLTTNNYSAASASTNNFLNPTRVTDTSLTNYATQASALNLGLVGLPGYIQVNAGVDILAGSDVGFNIQQPELLGLISLDLLQDITLTTYNNSDVVQETFNAGDLLDVSLLSGGNATLVFKTTKDFRKVRLAIGGLGLTPIRVFYAFIRPDADADGVPDCLDNCSGNDLLVNGKGEPLACYPDCNLNAGADISECPANSAGSVQLNSAGSGNTWLALSGNPSAATINSAGLVQGMSAPGIYRFRLYNSVCSDTVSVSYQMGNLNLDCNRALVGPNVILDEKTSFGGICLLCGNSGDSSVVDGNLRNYLEYSQLLSLLDSTSLIAVRDTNNIYPAGSRVGYVVSFPDGLLNANLLSAFQLRTSLNGNLVEVATSDNGLLGAGVLAGIGNNPRVSFVTTQPFDKVELIVGKVLGFWTTIRVYHAFVEPSSCPAGETIALEPQTACYEILTVDSVSVTKVNYDKTGFSGVACALCKIDSISHIVDKTYSNYATLTLPVGVAQKGFVSVQSKKVFTSGYEAGFAISADSTLLQLDILSNISVVTYLNGARQDSVSGDNTGLLSASLLPGANSVGFVGFRSQKAFNEVRIVVTAPVSANLLSSGLRIYYAYARLDTDGDGIPDCLDKCCSGDDLTDNDGDGVPDGCDVDINAENDIIDGLENTSIQIDVLNNDTYGIHGLDAFTITQQPAHGTVIIDDNGTPNDLTDDFLVYTPDSSFVGKDTALYQICDSYHICSQASVIIDVREAFKVLDDTVTLNEDTPAVVYVLNNDTFGPEGPGTSPVTIVTPPANGTATVNNNGTPNDPTDDFIEYSPDANFNGTDSLEYEVCDAANTCQTATVYFNVSPVNDAPVVNNDTVTVSANNPLSINVLANDHDLADGLNSLDSNSLSIITQPENGIVSIDPVTHEILYTPDTDFYGLDSFVYQVCDLGDPLPALCGQATVYIRVDEILSVKSDTVIINEDTPVTVDVLDNDSFGSEGPGASPVTIVTPAANGTAIVNNNGTPNDPTDDFIEYTPNLNFYGTDSLIYEICDGTNNCASATVVIYIQAVNDAPIANDDYVVLPSGGSIGVSVLDNDNDDADAPLGGLDLATLTILSQPFNGTATVNTFNGHIIYTADPGFYGYDTIVYRICDIGYPLPSKCDTAQLVVKAGEPDLSPNILILPSILEGPSTFYIVVEAHEINNAPTDGSEILLIMPRDPYIHFTYDPLLTSVPFFNVNNSNWTYDNSNPDFHIFRTSEVIPPNGGLSFGLEAFFDPQGSSGQKPITISIYQGGGESNYTNNTDVEILIYYGN